MVELLITLAVLASIILIALPDYLNTILPKHRVRAAARNVMTDMRFARMRGVSRNLEYRIIFSPGSESYVIQAGNRSAGSDTWVQEESTRDFSDPSSAVFQKGVTLDGGTTTQPILYKPTGTVSPAPTVVLSHPKTNTFTVSGSIAGRVKLNESSPAEVSESS